MEQSSYLAVCYYLAFVMMVIGVLFLLRFIRTKTLTRTAFAFSLGILLVASGMVISIETHTFSGFILLVIGVVLCLIGGIPHSYRQYQALKRLSKQLESTNSEHPKNCGIHNSSKKS
jgi:hypothetical protein